MAESFGRAIKSMQLHKKKRGVKVTNTVENMTHEQFADDTILAGINTMNKDEHMQKILVTYTKSSGQKENVEILEIFSLNTYAEREDQICNKL